MVTTYKGKFLIFLSTITVHGIACGDEIYPSAFPTDESLCSYLEEHSDCSKEECIELVCHEPCFPMDSSFPTVMASPSALSKAESYCEDIDGEVDCNIWQFETCEFSDPQTGVIEETLDYVHCKYSCTK